MRCRTRGQSMVEMAFVAPVLIVILFGIIDLSWYIFGYATVYQAARNGAETAASLPPGKGQVGLSNDPGAPPGPPNASDGCVGSILGSIQKGAVMFPDLAQPDNVRIVYPEKNDDGTPKRERGSSIEVSIEYDITPLTPLWNFVTFGTRGKMHVSVTTRRTIENLGQNPNANDGLYCEPN